MPFGCGQDMKEVGKELAMSENTQTKNEVFSMLSRGMTDDNKEVKSAIKKVKQLEDIYIASCADAKSESDVLVPVSESEYIKAQWKKIFGFSS